MTANRKVTARYAEIARFLGLHFNVSNDTQ